VRAAIEDHIGRGLLIYCGSHLCARSIREMAAKWARRQASRRAQLTPQMHAFMHVLNTIDGVPQPLLEENAGDDKMTAITQAMVSHRTFVKYVRPAAASVSHRRQNWWSSPLVTPRIDIDRRALAGAPAGHAVKPKDSCATLPIGDDATLPADDSCSVMQVVDSGFAAVEDGKVPSGGPEAVRHETPAPARPPPSPSPTRCDPRPRSCNDLREEQLLRHLASPSPRRLRQRPSRVSRRQFSMRDVEELFERVNNDVHVDVDQPAQALAAPNEGSQREQLNPTMREAGTTASSSDVDASIREMAAKWARRQASRRAQPVAKASDRCGPRLSNCTDLQEQQLLRQLSSPSPSRLRRF